MLAVITDFPMPPSVNGLFAGKARRYASDEYKRFKMEVAGWALKNAAIIRNARKQIEPHDRLRIDTYFAFRHERLYTLKGKDKMLDASNRIKALHDALAPILGRDDCHTWAGHFEKIVTVGAQPEHAIIAINAAVPRDTVRIYAELMGEILG